MSTTGRVPQTPVTPNLGVDPSCVQAIWRRVLNPTGRNEAAANVPEDSTLNTTMKTSTRRFAPALAVAAVIALSAGTGTAVAAKMITGADIKNNTVTSSDIKNGTLKGKDVKNKSLAESRFSGAVKSKLNATTTKGYEVKTSTTRLSTASDGTAYVACTTGKVAVGGGGSFETTEFDAIIQGSAPQRVIGDFFAPAEADFADGWAVTGLHNGLDPVDLTVYVICVDPS